MNFLAKLYFIFIGNGVGTYLEACFQYINHDRRYDTTDVFWVKLALLSAHNDMLKSLNEFLSHSVFIQTLFE